MTRPLTSPRTFHFTCASLLLALGCGSSMPEGSASNGGSGSSAAGGAGGASAGSGGTLPNGAGGSAGSVASGGSAGSSGSAGSTSGGSAGSGPVSCSNGTRDGDETGVDCGGSCGACLTYKVNPPDKDNNADSACNGGPGYMCARSMLFSPEMKQAAFDDWGMDDPPFVYATVGHDADVGGVDASGNTCCQCYQLVFESPVGAMDIPPPKPMIVQAFNTAAGGGKKFDVYMAAGGYGAFNGCVGGSTPMYDDFPEMGDNYSGGVKATRYPECSADGQYTLASVSSETCQSYVESQCNEIVASASAQNQSTSRASCVEANRPDTHYHINWTVRAKRVECPENLTRVTGCKLNPQGLPAPDPGVQTAAQADSSFLTGYETTTMQDCCRPTCAWPNNVDNADSQWSIFYTCDKAGLPATE